ncbi:outer membrane protein assembly factor BamB family protein [Gimesia panareensis]|uniref:Outer membrane biogenesis protein BamB n=1 Tax=Gimesia panareensis TaxID=2527978 RepID=A0A517Q4Y1_9PLAN|nr:PQQ-binding-like beta-propeller repeat protein [Gimesia panareensis]QDT26694.1 outer membrane biogenesis protein BamB [Gimesia panareensis]QDU50404.1 outer membrane biogenesis protein BamB [Gimesia panareensis]
MLAKGAPVCCFRNRKNGFSPFPGCLTLLSLLLFAGRLPAQVAVEVVAETTVQTSETAPHKIPGFSISVDEKKLNLLDDYERYVRHQMWEKALTTIKELSASKSTSALLPTRDGFLIDADQRIFRALTSLPAEGREAYRLFFDGKARKEFAELSEKGQLFSPDSKKQLVQIYYQYFLTSIGDDVADLLGDQAFERGDFIQAAQYWRSILDHHPDTSLPELDLNVKYALALIRGRQTGQAAATIEVISQQFSGQKVTLGGKSVDPVPYLKSLLPEKLTVSSSTKHNQGANHLTRALDLPDSKTEPRWQIHFLDKAVEQALQNSQNDYYGRRKSYATYVPPMAVDQQHAYFNYYGVCFGVDLQTGKLLWRSAKFKDLGNHFNNYSFHQSSHLNQYHVAVSGNYVLTTLIPQKEMNRYRACYRLTAYHKDTGKQLWQSKVNNESFICEPLVDGEQIYVISHMQNNKQLKLDCLSLKTGKREWSIPLGSVVAGNSSNGMVNMPSPLLQKEGDQLLILTNNGALFDISLASRSINWVFRYSYPVNQTDSNYYYAAVDEEVELHSQGQLFRARNLLFFKEAGANEVYALDLAAKKVLWKRPIKVSAQLVGIDDQHVYLLSKEMEALDRQSGRLNWAVSLPVEAGGLSAVIGSGQAWVFTSRGVFEISKTNGDIIDIYRGHDLNSMGGAIQLKQGLLICVSNQAVTAYPTRSVERQTSGP